MIPFNSTKRMRIASTAACFIFISIASFGCQNYSKLAIKKKLNEVCKSEPPSWAQRTRSPLELDPNYEEGKFRLCLDFWTHLPWKENIDPQRPFDPVASCKRQDSLWKYRFYQRNKFFWGAIQNKNYKGALAFIDSFLASAYKALPPPPQGVDPVSEWANILDAREAFTHWRIPLWLKLGQIDSIRFHTAVILPLRAIPIQSDMAEVIRILNPMPHHEMQEAVINSLSEIHEINLQEPYPFCHSPYIIRGYGITLFGFNFLGSPRRKTLPDYGQNEIDYIDRTSKETMKEASDASLDELISSYLIHDLYCTDPSLEERCNFDFPVAIEECAEYKAKHPKPAH